MRSIGLVCVTLLSAALVAAPATAALADGSATDCTVTIQLPATAESGQLFTMDVVESAGCAGATGLQPFSIDDHLASGVLHWGYDGIRATHTPGSGDAAFQGTAPNPGSWQPRVLGLGTDPGYRVVLTTMTTTPQLAPTPTSPPVKAVWVNDTLRIVHPRVATFGDGLDEYWTTYVDGKRVGVDEGLPRGADGSVDVARTASAGPAEVKVVATNVPDYDEISADTDTTIFDETVTRQVVKAAPDQVSAATLLDRLPVRAETHAASYAASRFSGWLDADHDGESTRTEVLKAESLQRAVVTAHRTVRSGRWVSRYDGRTVTDPAKLVVDHLVPLQEAWTSGAAAWSATKRSAYANDLGYGPSLIAVSATARAARADREPSGYLPSNASYRCTYLRSWIAVKYRWGLSVDAAEKNALDADLTRYCTNPFVTKPEVPDLAALVGRPTD